VDPNRPKVPKDVPLYELPEVFLNAKHYVTESSKFLLSRTAQNTFNLDQFYEEGEKACELIKRSQTFVSLLEQHRKEAERRWLLEKGRAAQLLEENNSLKAQLQQSGGTLTASNQRQFLMAINQLSWEAIRDTRQANSVNVKVSVTTENAERVLYQTEIVPGAESSTSRPAAAEGIAPSGSGVVGRQMPKRTTLPPTKRISFAESIGATSQEKESEKTSETLRESTSTAVTAILESADKPDEMDVTDEEETAPMEKISEEEYTTYMAELSAEEEAKAAKKAEKEAAMDTGEPLPSTEPQPSTSKFRPTPILPPSPTSTGTPVQDEPKIPSIREQVQSMLAQIAEEKKKTPTGKTPDKTARKTPEKTPEVPPKEKSKEDEDEDPQVANLIREPSPIPPMEEESASRPTTEKTSTKETSKRDSEKKSERRSSKDSDRRSSKGKASGSERKK